MPFSAASSATVPASSHVALGVLAAEARLGAPPVVGVELVGRAEAAGEEAAAERGVGDEADAELAQRRQHLVLDVAAEERVLALDGGHRVHRVRGADRLRRRLAEPVVADLALLHQLGQRPDGLLDRRVRVHAVLVVEVDVVGAEAAQRALDRLPHVLRRAVERRARPGRRRCAGRRTWWRSRPRRAGRPERGRAAPRCRAGRTAPRCRGTSPRARSRGGGWRSTRRRRSCRRRRTCPCSRGRGPRR